MHDARLVPSSFDQNDPSLSAERLPINWRWQTVEDTLRTLGAVGVMMRLPLFWQLEIPLFEACQRAGAFIFVADRANLPLSAEALEKAEIGCVVTDAQDALVFSAYLREKKREQPRGWFIIHAGISGLSDLSPLGDAPGAQEVHRSPGKLLLYQCDALRTLQRPHFHISEEAGGPVPENAAQGGTCVCGRTVVMPPAPAY
jgi:hypothetical protein